MSKEYFAAKPGLYGNSKIMVSGLMQVLLLKIEKTM